MKLKLFNGKLTSLALMVASGGYDPELGRVVIIVRGEGDEAGTLHIDVTEANKLITILGSGLPKVEKILATEATK